MGANRQKLLILTLVCVFFGCTTIQGIKNSQGMGESRSFSQSYDTVYSASLKAVEHLEGFSILEVDRVKGVIIAVHGISPVSNGERVAVFVNKLDEQHTKVEVVSKAIVKTHLFAPHWESQIFQLINMQLEK